MGVQYYTSVEIFSPGSVNLDAPHLSRPGRWISVCQWDLGSCYPLMGRLREVGLNDDWPKPCDVNAIIGWEYMDQKFHISASKFTTVFPLFYVAEVPESGLLAAVMALMKTHSVRLLFWSC